MLAAHPRSWRQTTTAWSFWIFIVFVPLTYSDTPGRCLTDVAEVFPKKYPHYNQDSINITLDMSSRITHRLSTHIFQIFVEEVLGYERIVINEFEDYFQIRTALDRIHNSKANRNNHDIREELPAAMINLEVWIPPEFDTASIQSTSYVIECGIASPPGRFGWFIPIELSAPVRRYYGNWNEDIREIHWSFLRDSNMVSQFTVDEPILLNLIKQNAMQNYESNSYFCDDAKCQDGVYTSDQCRNAPCALLLTSHYEATRFVIDHIEKMRLMVKVVWLGPNLESTAGRLKNEYIKRNSRKSFIILNWTPSDVILREDNFISVAFKNCELLTSNSDAKCKYEMNRLVKFSWSKLQEFAKPLFEAVKMFKISGAQYKSLLDSYENNRNLSVRDVACNWLRSNKPTWKFWKGTEDKPKIFIGGIFPMLDSPYRGKDVARASSEAVIAVNANKTILPDYKIHLLAADGDCRADKVMKHFIDYVTEEVYTNLIGVLGPSCSDTVEPIAGVSKYYNTMVISYSAEGANFADRIKYPYFFRTIGENINYKYVYLDLFKAMGWSRVAALTEDGQKYTEYISHMQELLKDNKITFIANTKFPRERENVEMTWYLEDLKKKRARIIIADIADSDARAVMCAAFKLNMTPAHGYVWFLPMWLNVTWYDTNYFSRRYNESINCTTAEMIRAISGYFSMTHAYFAPDDSIMQQNMTVGEWKAKYERTYGSKPTNYAGFAYDAVWTYAFAMQKLLKEDPEVMSHLHSENTTKKLVELVEQTDFSGVSGRIKFPKGRPSRYATINIMEWYDNATHIIGQYIPNISANVVPDTYSGELKLDWSAIKWFTPHGKKPDDGTPPLPTCALDAFAKWLNVECEMAVVILNILVAIILVVVVVTIVIIVKRKYDRKVQITKQYMKSLGIDLLNPHLIGNLDKWEIERENVFINRKVGEGAFGTVYGGEANMPEVGWVSVAVKTLKPGSSSEEKLDFLSEAEVMKRFDHKNIVKLLAVCTKDEPVYAVMEFMLYGDLKTYLLSRRNIDCEEYEELTNSKKLTNMALDVARGLSYLAELKYVHRDLASRNCLLDGNRVVKLGDFGMTRAMFENDYYRFHRRGMLPVRWMSPESLISGVFTPASDVWSYGILLYEIITFGGLPFNGHTNAQVLEMVKLGGTMVPPPGVKPQLEGLMKQCWNLDPKLRPSAKEIVSFLAENPRLLHACLDKPTKQHIHMEDSDQIQMPFVRRRSSASVKGSPAGGQNGAPGVSRNSPPPPVILQQNNSERFDSSTCGIPLENCGAKEPLLGRGKSSASLSLNFSKLMNRVESEEQESDGYVETFPPQGNAMSEV